MKKYIVIFSLPILFLFYGASINSYQTTLGPFLFPFESGNNNYKNKKQNDLKKEFKVEEGELFDIDLNTGGSIIIKGWEKNIVSVECVPGYTDLDEFEIDFEKTGSGVEVTSDYKNRNKSHNNNLKFIVKVPKKFNVRLNTMGGSITVKDVNGEISGKTMGGNLDLENLKGYIDLTTMGGPINLNDSEVDGKVHTMGGPVDIVNVTGNIEGTTMGGPVRYDNVKRK